MILDRIHDPSDVKQLNLTEVQQLCEELRTFLVESVSHTGGHLASNLGVVELTVAIHRVFDTSRDRLVFDVGHQCYAHKALTGRRGRFDTLRKLDGLSGFPKPRESVHDAFIAGHASNSISVALGMARARTLLGENYHVLALVGDASVSGGMSLEALNDAGASRERLIVILNDNGMSISRNVGSMSGYLAELRNKPGYYAFKTRYRKALAGSRAGERVYRVSHSVKRALKESLIPGSTVFENMGFTYLGPVDGHNVEQLTQMLKRAQDIQGPVVLHVHTVKGKGYSPAEDDPGRFHGVGPFDVLTGTAANSAAPGFSDAFGAELTQLARQNPKICAITAAMRNGTGLDGFAAEFPSRFFDVGIAEEHATAMAAGMAKQGLVPVFAVYSSFLQRGYDQLLHDVSLQALHVVLAVDRAGLVGADGETHHGCFDPLYLSQIPSMTVFCPASFAELRTMLGRAICDCTGPVAVRYPRGGEGRYREDHSADGAFSVLRGGVDCCIVTYGILINQALDAADILHQHGIEAQVIKLNRIDTAELQRLGVLSMSKRCVLVLEDCLSSGCVGQRLSSLWAQRGSMPDRVILKNLGVCVPDHGTVDQLYIRYQLDAGAVAAALEEALS